MSDYFERCKANPRQEFGTPGRLLHSDRLTAAQKLEVLKSWKAEAIHLSESKGEGMAGGERAQLSAIETAILELEGC